MLTYQYPEDAFKGTMENLEQAINNLEAYYANCVIFAPLRADETHRCLEDLRRIERRLRRIAKEDRAGG